jgi:DNA-binding transcriptional regulator YiaG
VTAAEIKAWRESYALNRTQAAEWLGVSRRTLFAYEEGARKIPKPVELACGSYKPT